MHREVVRIMNDVVVLVDRLPKVPEGSRVRKEGKHAEGSVLLHWYVQEHIFRVDHDPFPIDSERHVRQLGTAAEKYCTLNYLVRYSIQNPRKEVLNDELWHKADNGAGW